MLCCYLFFVLFHICRLFPKDSDDVIDFHGERTVEALSKFIDSNGKEAGDIPEEVCFFVFIVEFIQVRLFRRWLKKLKTKTNRLMKIFN